MLTNLQITPSKELIYHACFDGLQCARVDVPMDRNQTNDEEKRVSLAMVKLPSKVPVTDSRYGGALWLQPGCPGVSGVGFLQRHGNAIQMIIDSEIDASDPPDKSPLKLPKYFDIISIDPRGVNNTTPRFSCFPTAISRQMWKLQSHAEDFVGSSEESFDNAWARAQVLG